jgi:hypothetical protein
LLHPQTRQPPESARATAGNPMNTLSRIRRELEVAPTAGEKGLRALKLVARRGLLATGRWSMLPDFLIIGAQKAGTSSLYRYLTGHPDFARAFMKEVHYFDRHYDRGPLWYRSHFPLRLRGRFHERVRGRRLITGEATPDYLFDPRIPARVRELVPHARLIVLLRDPVSRALSHYHHQRRRGRESKSFAEAVERDESRLDAEEDRMRADPGYYSYAWDHFGYVRRGHYVRHLARWLEVFPRDQLLVLEAETFFQRTAEVYGRVLDFLGLPNARTRSFPVYNTGSYEPPESRVLERLRDGYRASNEQLYNLLGQRFSWD